MSTTRTETRRPSPVPVVMGREQPLPAIPDNVLRGVLFALVIAVAGALFALSFLPAASAVGKATMRFTGQFTGSVDDLQFPRFPERSTIYASDGSVLAQVFLDENRVIVRLKDIAPVARRAVLAIEDYRYYQHGALDLEGIVRAAVANLRAGEVEQGGSTITQQLVKSVFTGNERTLARKIEEARLAFRIEQEYSKDQILELYLNEIYMGRGVYGFGTAAQFYFGRPAKELTLPQAATLAGMVRSPEEFNPVTHPDAAVARRDVVLDRMAGLGWITTAAAEEAKAAPMKLSGRLRNQNKPGEAPYFVEYIKKQILNDRSFGKTYDARKRALFQGGLKIHTTLNPDWLEYAKEAVTGNLSDPNFPQAAVATVDAQTGAIRTLLGGTDFKKQKFDAASQGLRQPGSSFKPFTMVAALQQGIPRGKVYDTSPMTFGAPCFPSWSPHNAEGGSAGYINMDEAITHSVNLYFARLVSDVGPEDVVRVAHEMGITSDLYPGCAITLGASAVTPLEMASAYATLANDGVHCKPFAIARVTGPDGKVVQRHRKDCTRVIDSDIAATVSDMLQGPPSSGTATAANVGRPMAAKTGTTNDHADGWLVGYTPSQVATAVWAGDIRSENPIEDLPGPFGELFGGNLPASIWHDYMERVLAGLPVTQFPPPPAQKSAVVPKVVGMQKDKAIEVLAGANFTAIVKDVDAAAPAGTVVAQSPAGGSHATAGSAVTIEVSNGKTPRTVVPNTIGMPLAVAKAKLEGAGFKVHVEYQNVSNQASVGRVVDQDPQGGVRPDSGSTVTIFVGKYEPEPSPSPSASP